MENVQERKFPWLIVIIAILIVAAGLHWWLTKVPTDSAETSTDETSSISTSPVTDSPDLANNQTTTNNSSTTLTKNLMHIITLETNKGTIVFETYDADAPKTVENFITLASKGFYDNLIFHRVIEGFMIQGGDPSGNGMGGPGYKFADELNPNTESYKAGYVRGIVAMANAGPNTNGSQFFIMHKDTPLPHNYTIFGKVVKGMETVDAIATSLVGPGDKPTENMIIKNVIVTERP